jgi:S1-C subfamily serine protease
VRPADPSDDPRTDGEIVRDFLVRFYRAHRVLVLLGANALLTVAVILLFTLARPLPPRLTQRDIDAAVDRTLKKSPAPPSWASVAYAAIRPSVVRVEAVMAHGGADRVSLGTGVVIVDNGLILTALHVVQDAVKVKVTFWDGTPSDATVMVRQPDHDLAVLAAATLPDDLKPAVLTSSATLRVGDEVIAVGNPYGIPDSATDGIVSGLGREYTSRQTGATLTNLIQFDAAVNPGNSGGPLVNRAGEVVGIVVSLLNPTSEEVFIGIGFAVPIDTAGGVFGLPPM